MEATAAECLLRIVDRKAEPRTHTCRRVYYAQSGGGHFVRVVKSVQFLPMREGGRGEGTRKRRRRRLQNPKMVSSSSSPARVVVAASNCIV